MFDVSQVSPEEVGKIIHALQEEIKIIKLQLENLPGYGKGTLYALFYQILFHIL